MVCNIQIYMTVVSILVLVDAALRPDCWRIPGINYRSFNPCFSGCRPATEIEEE